MSVILHASDLHFGKAAPETVEMFRLESERFVPGEYVSLAEPGGPMRPYRVALVQPLDRD